MVRRPAPILASATACALLAFLSGCPVHVENTPVPNVAPNTFFERDPPFRVGGGDCGGGVPAGEQQHSRWVTFTSEVSFGWRGSDLDNDVVAYQYQLVEVDSLYYLTGGLQGNVIRSLDPRSESGEERWTERITDTFQTFRDLSDGWFEFRVRAIDATGEWDSTPALSRFEVFFDNVPPLPIIANPGQCGRLGPLTQARFQLTASDVSRKGPTPRSQLQYSVQLRASQNVNSCDSHLSDSFTEWLCFPSDDPNDVIILGAEPPTDYNDLTGTAGCVWTFTVRVRDPAGQITSLSCDLVK
ncbi:MAG TPA: hypothetical protein VKU85_10540 [bacterium]|nr:hypothetical protein [bacterium]